MLAQIRDEKYVSLVDRHFECLRTRLRRKKFKNVKDVLALNATYQVCIIEVWLSLWISNADTDWRYWIDFRTVHAKISFGLFFFYLLDWACSAVISCVELVSFWSLTSGSGASFSRGRATNRSDSSWGKMHTALLKSGQGNFTDAEKSPFLFERRKVPRSKIQQIGSEMLA